LSHGGVIWITGLSGSGKTTIADALVAELQKSFQSVIKLDGDVLRDTLRSLVPQTDAYSATTRLDLAKAYSSLCKLLSSQGFIVVIGTISLFSEIHRWNRLNLRNYFEVFLPVDPSLLQTQNPKGIYKDAKRALASSVVGNDLAPEEPLDPDLRLDRNLFSGPAEMVREILSELRQRGLMAGTEM
jgi:adenylylsulfate kinase